MSSPIRVLTIARTQLLRDGVSALIRSQSDMELAGTADTPNGAVERFLELSPEVTLIDVDLSDGAGISAVRGIRAVDPTACIIGLLLDEWDEAGRAALIAGAWSCVTKDRLAYDLPVVIRRACGRHP